MLQKELQEKTLLFSVDALMKIGHGQVRDSDEVYLRCFNAFSGYSCKFSVPEARYFKVSSTIIKVSH